MANNFAAGRSVGLGLRAVSRKTPIYFIKIGKKIKNEEEKKLKKIAGMDYMGKWGYCDRETCPQHVPTKVGDQRIQCDLLNTQTFRCQCHRIFCQFFFCIIRNHNPTNEANDANDGSVRDGRHPQALCLPLQVQGGRLQRVHNSEGFNVLVLNSSQQTR